MSRTIPPRPDQVPRPLDTSTAEAMLIVLGGLALLGVPMGVIGALAAGDAADLMRPRSLAVLAMFTGSGLVMLLASRALRDGQAWGRKAAIVAFLLLALLVGALVVGVWLSPEAGTGDGAGYLFLGGAIIVGMSFAGLISAVRRTF